jgi:hypothetical protein
MMVTLTAERPTALCDLSRMPMWAIDTDIEGALEIGIDIGAANRMLGIASWTCTTAVTVTTVNIQECNLI